MKILPNLSRQIIRSLKKSKFDCFVNFGYFTLTGMALDRKHGNDSVLDFELGILHTTSLANLANHCINTNRN